MHLLLASAKKTGTLLGTEQRSAADGVGSKVPRGRDACLIGDGMRLRSFIDQWLGSDPPSSKSNNQREIDMAETAKMILGDRQLEFPVIEGTEDEKAIDIRNLRNETGYITFDPALGQHRCLREQDHVHRRREGHPAVPRDSDRAVPAGSQFCARGLAADLSVACRRPTSWRTSASC